MTSLNLRLLGEVEVKRNWTQINEEIFDEPTFVFTSTILNQDDWDKWKFRSTAKIRFLYPLVTGTYVSREYWIKPSDTPQIFVIPTEQILYNQGLIIKYIQIKRASKFLPFTKEEMFAAWQLKVEVS